MSWGPITVFLFYHLTPQKISIRAIDGASNISQVIQRTVTTIDKTPPILRITGPEQDPISLLGTNAGATLSRLEGTARDDQSGVQKVEWALDPQSTSQYTQIPLTPAQDGSFRWSVENVPIPGPVGVPHIIKVRCFDVAGNASAEQDRNVAVVTQTYPPKDPTVQEYFGSLIDFIVRRIVAKGSSGASDRLLQVNDLTAE